MLDATCSLEKWPGVAYVCVQLQMFHMLPAIVSCVLQRAGLHLLSSLSSPCAHRRRCASTLRALMLLLLCHVLLNS